MTTRLITRDQLSALREVWHSTSEAKEFARIAGLAAHVGLMSVALHDLESVTYHIDVPCALCHNGYPVEVKLAERTWPASVVCSDCDDRTLEMSAAEILAEHGHPAYRQSAP